MTRNWTIGMLLAGCLAAGLASCQPPPPKGGRAATPGKSGAATTQPDRLGGATTRPDRQAGAATQPDILTGAATQPHVLADAANQPDLLSGAAIHPDGLAGLAAVPATQPVPLVGELIVSPAPPAVAPAIQPAAVVAQLPAPPTPLPAIAPPEPMAPGPLTAPQAPAIVQGRPVRLASVEFGEGLELAGGPVSPGQVIQPATPTTRPDGSVRPPGPAAAAGQPVIAAGLPPGVKPEFVMEGKGSPPAANDPNVRQRAAVQAAICVAIYNTTAVVNSRTRTEPIPGGFVNSDHFRYTAGLEVKGRTTVIDGKVQQFDVWLTAPPAAQPPQDRLEVHVRTFVLQGPPLAQDQLDRLLQAAGGHLVVQKITGPDPHGLYTAEVGLVRKAK